MRIFYKDVEIFDSGSSTAVDENDNPLNWPPKATDFVGSSNYPSTFTNGTAHKLAYQISQSGGSFYEQQPQLRHYLIPDVHYDVIKNGTSIEGNNSIESTLPAGSHFLLGDYKTETSFNLGGVPGRFSRHYYFSLIRVDNPPPIYRNSLGLEDASDDDFNDLIVTVTSGSGFFTGDVKENTVNNASTNINVGNQVSFTLTGTFTWTVPDGITSISAVCVGGGGGGGRASGENIGPQGGGGGGLSYQNNISVTPGESLTVIVGEGGAGGTSSSPTGGTGGTSEIKSGTTTLVKANGGSGGARQVFGSVSGGSGGSTLGYTGGGDGGFGGNGASDSAGGAGGGAAGYSGNGGNGGSTNLNSGQTAGSGGGGGGGEADSDGSGGGGGVGILGEGSSGAATGDPIGSGSIGVGGFGGSGGSNGNSTAQDVAGGEYGGGGGTFEDDSFKDGGDGGQGAVRIIWGTGRAFPSTSVSDTFDSGDWGKFTNNSFIVNKSGQFNFATFRHAGNRDSFLLYKNSNDYILLKASSTNSIGASTTVAGVLTQGTYEVYARKGNNFSNGMHAQVQSIDVDKYPSRAFYNPN
tara:strand:+ start:8 stop:1741 length:1734 start_codon:yes stop_codon:yes gene_type:complete